MKYVSFLLALSLCTLSLSAAIEGDPESAAAQATERRRENRRFWGRLAIATTILAGTACDLYLAATTHNPCTPEATQTDDGTCELTECPDLSGSQMPVALIALATRIPGAFGLWALR